MRSLLAIQQSPQWAVPLALPLTCGPIFDSGSAENLANMAWPFYTTAWCITSFAQAERIGADRFRIH